MLATHIYFNGDCKETIEFYVKALDAAVETIIPKPGQEELIIHAQILIHGQMLMLNDFGGGEGLSKSGGYQLSLRFDNEGDLKKAYAAMKEGSTTILPMQRADYSPCVVRFIDRFDVRWAFWV